MNKTEQANFFARALLMPETKFREIVKFYTNADGTCNTKSVAEYFGVSVSAASQRSRDLGIFKKDMLSQ